MTPPAPTPQTQEQTPHWSVHSPEFIGTIMGTNGSAIYDAYRCGEWIQLRLSTNPTDINSYRIVSSRDDVPWMAKAKEMLARPRPAEAPAPQPHALLTAAEALLPHLTKMDVHHPDMRIAINGLAAAVRMTKACSAAEAPKGPLLSPQEQQRRGFAYGNVAIDNQEVTRAIIDTAADEMAKACSAAEAPEGPKADVNARLLDACEMILGFHGGYMTAWQFGRRYQMQVDRFETLDACLAKLRAAVKNATGREFAVDSPAVALGLMPGETDDDDSYVSVPPKPVAPKPEDPESEDHRIVEATKASYNAQASFVGKPGWEVADYETHQRCIAQYRAGLEAAGFVKPRPLPPQPVPAVIETPEEVAKRVVFSDGGDVGIGWKGGPNIATWSNSVEDKVAVLARIIRERDAAVIPAARAAALDEAAKVIRHEFYPAASPAELRNLACDKLSAMANEARGLKAKGGA
jgi:hypothetical protein